MQLILWYNTIAQKYAFCKNGKSNSNNRGRALLFNEDGMTTPRTEKILRSTPMGRFGEAEELLGTMEWLLLFCI